MMQRRDWTLLLLAAANGDVLTPVQLQKTAFLLGKEFSEAVGTSYYDFIAYDYGPFNQEVYQDVEALAQDGLAAIELSSNRRWKEYRATQRGINVADELKKNIDPKVATWIEQLVQWARSLSFQQLVRFVYNKYPAYKENSVFQD